MATTTQFRQLFAVGGLLVNSTGNACSFPELPPDGVLGLYFTAQCFGDEFAPTLADFYRKYGQRQTPTNRKFEIIAVSLDDDEASFDELRATMPWPSLRTYDDQGAIENFYLRVRENKFLTSWTHHPIPASVTHCVERVLEALRRRYRYHRLPSLILVDSMSGTLVTDIGRQCVLNDLEGNNFPWSQPSLSSILNNGVPLLYGTQSVDSQQALEGKLTGLYFSSHDCAPCQEFTPLLVESYVRIKSGGCHQFEIILISGDDTLQEFTENYSSMPWLALPFADIRIFQLESHFQVYGYPQLILLDRNNELITTEGCNVILTDPKGWNFPWSIQLVEELTDDTEIVLRFRPCLVLLTGGREDLIKQAVQLLSTVARDYHRQQKASKDSSLPDLHFFYEGERSSDAVETMTNNLHLDLQKQQTVETSSLRPRVVLVDMKGDRCFVCWSDENSSLDAVTDESLRYLVNKYKNGTLMFRQIPDPEPINTS